MVFFQCLPMAGRDTRLCGEFFVICDVTHIVSATAILNFPSCITVMCDVACGAPRYHKHITRYRLGGRVWIGYC